jgi:membrane fusion protein (multidrug efflux system)
MKTRYLVLAGFIVMILLMVMTLVKNKSKFDLKPDEKAGKNARYVKVQQAEPDSVMVEIEGQGRIISSRKVDVAAEVQGMLLPGRVLKAGQSVRAGEALFQLRDQDARLALQARKSAYLNILANALPDIRLDYPDSYTEWKNFFDKIDVEKAIPELPTPKNSKEKTFVASRNIIGEYYTIKAEEERLKKYTVVAPFDGTITDVFAEPGAVVNPGTKLLSIIKGDDLEIEVPIDVQNISWLKIGQDVVLQSTSGEQTYAGKIIRIGSFVNASTQSIPVFVQILKKPADVLYNGMYLTAKIQAGKIANTIRIPRRALLDENMIYLWKDSTLHKTNIDIKFVTREDVIASGIDKGSMVVIEPLANVNDSTKFNPIVKK